MSEHYPELISIHTLSNRFEADLLLDILEQEGIPAVLRTFEETPYTGLFVPQRGWGRILVPRELGFKAKSVLMPVLAELESDSLFLDPGEVDSLLWERLRQAEPGTVCRNALVDYDPSEQTYIIRLLGTRFICDPGRELIAPEVDSTLRVDFELCLVALHYLLEAQSLDLSGDWIGEKEIPAGAQFFRGPHQFRFKPLLEAVNSDPGIFSAASERLGGTPLDMGDFACKIPVLPRVPVVLVLWNGDDEFDPVIHARFDRTINLHLHGLDTIWAMMNMTCRAMVKAVADLTMTQDS